MLSHEQRQHRAWVAFGLTFIAAISIALGHTQPQPDPLPDREVQIRLTNGQVVRGILVQSDETQLIIRNGKIKTTIDRADIEEIKTLPTFQEQYDKLRNAISIADTPSFLRLVEWLVQREKYDLALKELDALLARYPMNRQAAQQRTQLVAQIELRTADNMSNEKLITAPVVDRDQDFPLLSAAEISIIKVFELDVDNPPKIEISKRTIEKLMSQFAGDPRIPATHEQREAMFRMPAKDILKLMFELRARDLYGEVKVFGHTESIRRFKSDVHRPWIQTRCVQCHNISSDSSLRLFSQRNRANSDQAVYTNFLILDRFVTSDGQSLIDVDNPERSPLLQIALARQNSIYPHPPVLDPENGRDLFVPAFRTTKERRFQQGVQWIESLYTPRVEYPVDLREIPKPDDEEPEIDADHEADPVTTAPVNPPANSGGGER